MEAYENINDIGMLVEQVTERKADISEDTFVRTTQRNTDEDCN